MRTELSQGPVIVAVRLNLSPRSSPSSCGVAVSQEPGRALSSAQRESRRFSSAFSGFSFAFYHPALGYLYSLKKKKKTLWQEGTGLVFEVP